MIFSHVRKIVRPMGTVNDEFFLSIAHPIKSRRNFMRQFPALGVCSILTSQLLNNKKIVVYLSWLILLRDQKFEKR